MEIPFLTYLWSILMRALLSMVNNQGADGLMSDLSPTCKKYVTGLVQRALLRKFNEVDKQMIAMSGRFINELGQFSSCNASPNMAYYLFQAGADFIRINLGVCFSQECTEGDWDIMRNYLYTKVKEKISKPTSYFYKVNDYLVINVSRVVEGAKTILPDPLTKIFFASLLSFIFLVAVATLCRKFRGRRRTSLSPKQSSTFFGSDEDKAQDIEFQDSTTQMKACSLIDGFTAQHNWRSIQAYQPNSPINLTIDILRILSYLGVMTMNFAFSHSLVSKIYADSSTRDYYLHGIQHTVLQGSLFVPDLLLFISGFTGLQSVLRVYERSAVYAHKKRLPLVYLAILLKRYIRYVFVLFFGMTYVWKILPLVASGPLAATDIGCTKRNFLASVFLLNSTFAGNNSRMCAPWYWYPAAEFQLFIGVPLLAFIYLHYPKTAISGSFALSILGLIVTAGYNQFYHIKAVNDHDTSWITSCMSVSYVRSFCYFLGTSCAFLQNFARLRARKQNSIAVQEMILGDQQTRVQIRKDMFWQKNWFVNVCIWAGLSLFAVDFTIFYKFFQAYKHNLWYPQWKHTLFNTFGPSGFAVSILMIFSGLIRKWYPWVVLFVADTKGFKLLRAIYFEVFIVAVPFILTLLFSLQTIQGFSPLFTYFSLIWESLLTVLIAIIFYFFISRPFTTILNKMFPL